MPLGRPRLSGINGFGAPLHVERSSRETGHGRRDRGDNVRRTLGVEVNRRRNVSPNGRVEGDGGLGRFIRGGITVDVSDNLGGLAASEGAVGLVYRTVTFSLSAGSRKEGSNKPTHLPVGRSNNPR